MPALVIRTPDGDDRALAAEVTGWPAGRPEATPVAWAPALMVGLRSVLLDPALGIDVLTTRLIEASLETTEPPDRPGDVTVAATVLDVVDLGAMAGLRIAIDIGGQARALLTVGASGTGLTPGGRPPAPGRAPSGRGEASWTSQVVVRPEAVDRFADWCEDDTPFHTDAAAAAAAGLAGPTAPGLFVLGLLAGAAASATGTAARSVAARFVRPAGLGAVLTLAGTAPEADGRAAITATGADGPVVRRAWVGP